MLHGRFRTDSGWVQNCFFGEQCSYGLFFENSAVTGFLGRIVQCQTVFFFENSTVPACFFVETVTVQCQTVFLENSMRIVQWHSAGLLFVENSTVLDFLGE